MFSISWSTLPRLLRLSNACHHRQKAAPALLCVAVLMGLWVRAANGQASTQLHGRWAAVFQKLDNGEENTLHLALQQTGDVLQGHFSTIGYDGDIAGTIHDGEFVLFAPWDKQKPYCKGKVEGADLLIDLLWGTPFKVHPEREEDKPKLPAYIAPPALHKVSWNGLAKTPPMGWNSWNHFGGGVTDTDVRAAADALVSTGMRDRGYVYVNIDDTWEGVRDAQGVLQPNHKFPDMKALAEYVHARGLKLGIYSSPGPRTCGGYPGSYGHEALDARTWADWGVDYLKYDWCSAAQIYKDTDLQAVYQRMGDALQASGRPIVYSLCEYGTNHVENWGADVGGNLWRTTGDIRDEWVSMEANGFSQDHLAFAAGPGHWNDPDMLEVGNGKMMFDEYKAHMSLWSLLAAPLIAGNDLSKMSPETRELLMNAGMIAIDQDPLGRQATLLVRVGGLDLLRRPLADGGYAFGIFNRSAATITHSIALSDLGIAGNASALEIWTGKKAIFSRGKYEAMVPSHGVLVLRVGAVRE
jgi:alpha-galactosidase